MQRDDKAHPRKSVEKKEGKFIVVTNYLKRNNVSKKVPLVNIFRIVCVASFALPFDTVLLDKQN